MRVLQYVLATAFVKACQVIDLYEEWKMRLGNNDTRREFDS